MENTVLYLDYYLTLIENGYSHDTALQSVNSFMDEQHPSGGSNDFQVVVMKNSVNRVCRRVDRLLHPVEEV